MAVAALNNDIEGRMKESPLLIIARAFLTLLLILYVCLIFVAVVFTWREVRDRVPDLVRNALHSSTSSNKRVQTSVEVIGHKGRAYVPYSQLLWPKLTVSSPSALTAYKPTDQLSIDRGDRTNRLTATPAASINAPQYLYPAKAGDKYCSYDVKTRSKLEPAYEYEYSTIESSDYQNTEEEEAKMSMTSETDMHQYCLAGGADLPVDRQRAAEEEENAAIVPDPKEISDNEEAQQRVQAHLQGGATSGPVLCPTGAEGTSIYDTGTTSDDLNLRPSAPADTFVLEIVLYIFATVMVFECIKAAIQSDLDDEEEE
jgi:hypothetical protein